MSVGAVGMNLLHAAHAHGFVASWITGWATYDATVRAAICEGDEQHRRFLLYRHPGQALEERPPHPAISSWPNANSRIPAGISGVPTL